MRVLLRGLDALGVLSLVLVWLWGAILLLPIFLKNDSVNEFLHPTSSQQPVVKPLVTIEAPPTWLVFVIVAVSFLVVFAGVWAMLRAPKEVVRVSERATNATATRIVNQVADHRPLNKNQRFVLSQRIIFILKLAASLLGALLAVIGAYMTDQRAIDRDVALVTALFLSVWPLLWFSVEYIIIATTGRVDVRKK